MGQCKFSCLIPGCLECLYHVSYFYEWKASGWLRNTRQYKVDLTDSISGLSRPTTILIRGPIRPSISITIYNFVTAGLLTCGWKLPSQHLPFHPIIHSSLPSPIPPCPPIPSTHTLSLVNTISISWKRAFCKLFWLKDNCASEKVGQ